MPPSLTRAFPSHHPAKAQMRDGTPETGWGDEAPAAVTPALRLAKPGPAARAMGRVQGIGNANQVKNDLGRFVWNAMAGSAFASWVGGM